MDSMQYSAHTDQQQQHQQQHNNHQQQHQTKSNLCNLQLRVTTSSSSRSPSRTRRNDLMSRERDTRSESSGAHRHNKSNSNNNEFTTIGTSGSVSGGGGGGTNNFLGLSGIGTGITTAAGSSLLTAAAVAGNDGSTITGGNSSHHHNAVASYRGFRSHSPSNRRSRERNRREFQRTHGSDQGGLLAYGSGSGGGTVAAILGDMNAGDSGGGVGGIDVEDSRLSGNEDYCYQSFASDDVDALNPPASLVDGLGSGNKKLQQQQQTRNERSSSLQALDRLNTKIQCTKESIRQEQTARDENVNEYLKLAASADKQQLQRIKAVFEKKNQKSAHTISQLQKKLDNYTKRAKDLQQQQYNSNASSSKSQHRQPREVLRDVGQGLRNVGGNIRDGISGFSGSVMSKPREFAHLIKNKFGSADNINQISEAELNALNMPSSHAEMIGGMSGGLSLACNAIATGNANTAGSMLPTASTGSGNTGGAGSGKFNSDNGSECSNVTSESLPAGSGKSQSGASQQYHIVLKTLLTQLSERKDDIEKLKERVERLETTQKDYNNLTATLESERYRAEGLEEQINDLTELHQNEIENLKQTIADMEEKVQYQSDERLRDVNEVLENCQTRISKMEHMSQQQYVTVEGIDNSNARALVVKLINVVLTILQVVLLLVATAAGIIMPFLKTRVRVLTTFLSIFVVIFVIRQWPDVQDIGGGLVRHLKESLVVK